jgi:hypothetical protein
MGDEKKKTPTAYEAFVKSNSELKQMYEVMTRLSHDAVAEIPSVIAGFADKKNQEAYFAELSGAEQHLPKSQFQAKARQTLESLVSIRDTQARGNFGLNLGKIIDSTPKDVLSILAMNVEYKPTGKKEIDEIGEAYKTIRKAQEAISQIPENPYEVSSEDLEKMKAEVAKDMKFKLLSEEEEKEKLPNMTPDELASYAATKIILSGPAFVTGRFLNIHRAKTQKAIGIVSGKEKGYLHAVLKSDKGYDTYVSVIESIEQQRQKQQKAA